ncbi:MULTISPECIES: hypothetical protein [Bacteroidales]|uniref:hypothetical protein n=1 Tax=Bacteroides pyogenes TaxID=310300 RepID=UPI002F953325
MHILDDYDGHARRGTMESCGIYYGMGLACILLVWYDMPVPLNSQHCMLQVIHL